MRRRSCGARCSSTTSSTRSATASSRCATSATSPRRSSISNLSAADADHVLLRRPAAGALEHMARALARDRARDRARRGRRRCRRARSTSRRLIASSWPRHAWSSPVAVSRRRLQSSQKCSVIAEMIPTSRAGSSRRASSAPGPRRGSVVGWRRAAPSAASIARADLRGRELGVGRVERAARHRHVLDEPRRRAARPGVLAERDELVVVHAAQRDRVELDAQAGGDRGVDAGEHAREIAAAGERRANRPASSVSIEMLIAESPAARERRAPARRAGGRSIVITTCSMPGHRARSGATRSTMPLRTVGSPPVSRTLRTPRPREHARPARSISSNVRTATRGSKLELVSEVLGHAVRAAVVAAVGDRHAKIADAPRESRRPAGRPTPGSTRRGSARRRTGRSTRVMRHAPLRPDSTSTSSTVAR